MDIQYQPDGGVYELNQEQLQQAVAECLNWETERQISNEFEKMMVIDAGGGASASAANYTPKEENPSACYYGNTAFSWKPVPPPGDPGVKFGPGVGNTNSWLQSNLASDLPSNDLEMDKDLSLNTGTQGFVTSVNPVNTKPFHASTLSQPFQGQSEISKNWFEPHKGYANEQKLRRYDIVTESDNSVEASDQHQQWQQHMSQTTAETMEMVVEEEVYSIEPDEFGECPLHTLSVISNKDVMANVLQVLGNSKVMDQCINMQNKQKQTPLFLAVQAGNIAMVGWLLLNGADPNIQGTLYTDRDEYVWRAPLHLAAMMGDEAFSILRLLLTREKNIPADINLRSHADKMTALNLALKTHAAKHNCRKIIMELIDQQADMTIRDMSNSKTPLIMAIETRDIQLVHDILEKFTVDRCRALLQHQTRSGDTCLHIAAGLSRFSSQDKEKLLRLLVTKGADGNIHNNVRELPRDYARAEWDRIRNF